jgi:hypothetical protein
MPLGGAPEVIASAGAFPVTDADCEALPPPPVQLSVYVIVPADPGVTDRWPFMDSEPDQSLSLGLAEAVQAVAFVLDQVNITAWPTVKLLGNAEIVTVG